MSITYNNMTVSKVITENEYYDSNKKKRIKYKKPKITKTKIYEGSPYCIGELYKTLDFLIDDNLEGQGYYEQAVLKVELDVERMY